MSIDKVRAMVSIRNKLHRVVRASSNESYWLYGCRQHGAVKLADSSTIIVEQRDGIPSLPRAALNYCHICWPDNGG